MKEEFITVPKRKGNAVTTREAPESFGSRSNRKAQPGPLLWSLQQGMGYGRVGKVERVRTGQALGYEDALLVVHSQAPG